jgi:hypothetical protein
MAASAPTTDNVSTSCVGPLQTSTTNEKRSITSLLDLPMEIVVQVLQALGPKDLAAVAQVSSALYNVANSSPVWQCLCCSWGISDHTGFSSSLCLFDLTCART